MSSRKGENAMRDYIIMTDSCCSLNRREVDELGITAVSYTHLTLPTN